MKVKLIKNENEVSNKMVLMNDLVGLEVKDDNKTKVFIVKNELNDVQGFIPPEMWNDLVDDALNENKPKEENEFSEIKDLFDVLIKELGETPKTSKEDFMQKLYGEDYKETLEKGVESVVKEVHDKLGDFEAPIKDLWKSLGSKLEDKIIRETPKVQDIQDKLSTFEETLKSALNPKQNTEVDSLIETLEEECDDLENLLNLSEYYGVETKKFIKNINKEYNRKQEMLEELYNKKEGK